MKGEFICKAYRVTETHPLAHQMGDINDIEDYKQKIEKQHKLRKKTIKAVYVKKKVLNYFIFGLHLKMKIWKIFIRF